MPRTRSLAWSELKIGILAVAALVLAVMIVLAVGGQGGFAWERYELKTKFPSAKGLRDGAVVRVAGVDVGKVTGVEFAGAEVLITLEVNDENKSRITDQSRASIGSLSLLGEPIIEISPATHGTPLKDGDLIPSVRTPGEFADVAENASQGLEQATALIREIRAGKGTIGQLFTNDQMYKEMNAFVGAAQEVANAINRGRGTAGLFVNDPTAYRRANAALGDLQTMTRRINAGEGSLGKLLKDEQLAKSLTATGNSMEQITARLQRGEGTAGKLLTDQQLFDRFTVLAGRMEKLAANLESGEGSAGQFLQNKQLYENMNGAASELKALIGEIKKDPKKYLNVRVSIF
jgi:phospholipid/cholesterol/gamma-HCH transport system substrate-binding protein